jgi:hypothetical protein
MYPRRLKDLVQLSIPERLDVLAEGLGLLTEQATILRDDVSFLDEANRRRGSAALGVIADEEAAKTLILLDLIRGGWNDQNQVRRQLGWFYDHLARGIYAELCGMRPADFAEVCRLVEMYRPSHYLDGPNDIDYIFRNETLVQREEALYVDYIREENESRWVGPRSDGLSFGHLTSALDLVISLGRIGCTSRRGLNIIASTWSGQTIQETTHWREVRSLNVQIVRELGREGLFSPDADETDTGRVVDGWTFPLAQLDLDLIKVDVRELRTDRTNRLSNWHNF